MAREFTKVGIVGLGTMGAGIVEVFARNGIDVVGYEINDGALAAGRGRLEGSAQRAVDRGKMTVAAKDELLGHISLTTDLVDLAPCQLVLEAVPEQLPLKRDLFGKLDDIVSEDAILATNTSSLSVTEIAAATKKPQRVVGMHFFNPAPVLKLVEVISTVITDDAVVDDIRALAERLGKTPVVIGDKAGFIANALLLPYLNHAISFYENKYASREDLDAAMVHGCGYPMGPLALLDLIGLDTSLAVLDTMYREDRDKLHAPSPILKQMVTAGLLGRKTGRGFYTYDKPGSGKVVDDHLTPKPRPADAPMREIRSVAVVGTGVMGTGIVEVFAKAGFDVTYVGRTQDKVDAVRAAVEASQDKAIAKEKATAQDKEAVLAKITGTLDLTAVAQADLVVEALAEDLDLKLETFARLDEICKEGAILATTTSSLPVISCAAATKRQQDVLGMHFFNPAPVMKLVEVVHTVSTSQEVIDTIGALCETLGKVAVSTADRAGFVVNALLFPYLNEAVRMLEAHYGTADDIDLAMKNGCGLPMGPFELLDTVGLDISHAIQRELYLEFRDRGFAPAPLLEHMVTAGYLGRKSGRGFRVHA